MVVLDRSAALRPALQSVPERPAVAENGGQIEALCGRFANWLVLAHHLIRRGENLRAWDALGHVHRHLLWMARLTTGSTNHWLTPSRRAEAELAPHDLTELRRATAAADPDELTAALQAAWRSGRRYWTALAQRHHLPLPNDLFNEINTACNSDPPSRDPRRRS
jgi:lincosamide nucleotidyltransferase